MKIIKGFHDNTEEIFNDKHSVKIVLSSGIEIRIQEVMGNIEISKQGNDDDSLLITPRYSNTIWVK